MARRKKINLPLIEVIIASLVLHLVALLILGGYTVWQVVQTEEAEFEAPAPVEAVEPKKQERQVRMEKKQRQSRRPTPKITVVNPSQLNMPALDIDVPVVDARVSVGAGGAGGLKRSFGSEGIDFSRSAVNFFGIKSQGERIMFIVDASNFALEDQKGGIPAYTIMKEELTKMVGGLSPGTLFNVMFFSSGNTLIFSPNMLAATQKNKDRCSKWIEPINRAGGGMGVGNNISIKREDIKPMTKYAGNWPRALQIAMEQGVDNIFMLVSSWHLHNVGNLTRDELIQWRRDKGFTEKDQERWDNKYVPEANAALAKENEARRKAGQPPRVVITIGRIVREMYPNAKHPPTPTFNPEEIKEFVRNGRRLIYKDLERKKPLVNIVLFTGKDEAKTEPAMNAASTNFKEVAKKNSGKFRVLEGLEGLKSFTISRQTEG